MFLGIQHTVRGNGAEGWRQERSGEQALPAPSLQGVFRPEDPGWYQTLSTGLPGMLPIKVGQRWMSASFNYGLSQISGEKEEKIFYIKWCNEKSPLRERPTDNSSQQVLPLAY